MTTAIPPEILGSPPLHEWNRAIAWLRTHGTLAFTAPTTRTDVHTLATRLMRLYHHPDGGSDGITELRATDTAAVPGRGGFTNGELLPHTDRSSLPTPPHLLLLVCHTPAEVGGETLIVDGRQLFADLAATAPELLEALTQRGAAYFGDAAGHTAPVFERIASGRWSIRLRQDELARFSPPLRPHLKALHSAIDRNTQPLRLQPGQALLLDNTRWLHGRCPFSGQRRMLRALGTPHPDTPLTRGFYAF